MNIMGQQTDLGTPNSGVKSDYHSHLLPGVDDGAADVNVSLDMLKMYADQGVETVAATPHFFRSDEDVGLFIARRKEALELLSPHLRRANSPKIVLGAEIAIQPEISETDLTALCIEGTNLLLLEMPYAPLRSWVVEEIQNIAYAYKVLPVLAHVDRYLKWYTLDHFRNLFSLDNFLIQINMYSLTQKKPMKFIKSLLKENLPFVLGTDAHDASLRPPNFFDAQKQLKALTAKGYKVINL